MAISTTVIEASLTTKLNATTGTTDGKEFLLLGKAVEALTPTVTVNSVISEGTTQVAAVAAQGTTSVAAVAAQGALYAQKALNLSDIASPATALSNLGFAAQFTSVADQQTILYNSALSKWVNADLPSSIITQTISPPYNSGTYILGDMWVNSTSAEIWVCTSVDTTVSPTEYIWKGNQGGLVGLAQGEKLFVNENYTGNTLSAYSPFNTTFVIPVGVTSICAVCVGGGGGGHSTWANYGGSGGALAWANNIVVTPGETLSLTIGKGGALGNVGSTTSIKRGSTIIFGAEGGRYGGNSMSTIAKPVQGTVTPGNFSSGRGGLTYAGGYGGGGGAGGYSGNGGNGMYGTTGNSNNTLNNTNGGTGGAAGGGIGYASSTYGTGGGGGVGLYGEGPSGPPNTFTATNSHTNSMRHSGNPGSGGEAGVSNHNQANISHGPATGQSNGYGYFGNWDNTSKSFPQMSTDGTVVSSGTRNTTTQQGGHFGGGGGGGGTSNTAHNGGYVGGMGGARILYGEGRSFPTTNVKLLPSYNVDGTTP